MIIAGVDVPDRLADMTDADFQVWSLHMFSAETRLQGHHVEFVEWAVRQNQPLSWAVTHYNNFFTVSQPDFNFHGVMIPAENMDVPVQEFIAFVEALSHTLQSIFCHYAAIPGARVSQRIADWQAGYQPAEVDHQTGRGPRSQADTNASSAIQRLWEQNGGYGVVPQGISYFSGEVQSGQAIRLTGNLDPPQSWREHYEVGYDTGSGRVAYGGFILPTTQNNLDSKVFLDIVRRTAEHLERISLKEVPEHKDCIDIPFKLIADTTGRLSPGGVLWLHREMSIQYQIPDISLETAKLYWTLEDIFTSKVIIDGQRYYTKLLQVPCLLGRMEFDLKSTKNNRAYLHVHFKIEAGSIVATGLSDVYKRLRSNMTLTRSGRKVNFGVTGGRLSR